MKTRSWIVIAMISMCVYSATAQIVHDAEYYIIEAQNGERWATEDKALDDKLAEFQKKNGGKPPNILSFSRSRRARAFVSGQIRSAR